MSDGTIEILGQKLSYPASWHGVAAVIALCTATVAVSYIFTKWISPEKLVTALNYASVQEAKVAEITRANQVLLDQIGKLELQVKTLSSQNSHAEVEKVKLEVSSLQEQRETLYSALQAHETVQSSVVANIAPKLGGQQQVQILQQQQQQQQQFQQQQQQIQQQIQQQR